MGASICAIKYAFIDRSQEIFRHEIIVKGFGRTIVSHGYVVLNLQIKYVMFEQTFYVPSELRNCVSDKILGQIFITKHKGVVNFEDFTISFKKNKEYIERTPNENNKI